MKKKLYVVFLSCVALMISGCDIPGVTVPFSDSEINNSTYNQEADNTNEGVTGETLDSMDFEKTFIPEDKKIYHIGDGIKPLFAVDGEITNLKPYMEFRVDQAKLYEDASDMGIDTSLYAEGVEIYTQFSPMLPKYIEKKDYINAKALLCDVSIQYEDFFLEQESQDNITFLSLIYVNDDKSYVNLGRPFYLSNSNNRIKHYTNFDIGSGEIKLQVGWVIDESLLEVEKIEPDRLYVCTAYNGNEVFQEFVHLDLTEGRD